MHPSAPFASACRPCSSATISHRRSSLCWWTTALLSTAAILVGLILATRILRPIHVINSGLMKLSRGEKVGSIDLPPEEELEGVGESFRAISEKLAARSLGRLMAGVTHEVRNPLNAMTIHLELVREHLLRLAVRAPVGAVLRLEGRNEPPVDVDGAREHIDVIASEIKRLDEVITGFVRFIRPEELQLQPVNVRGADQRSHRARRARRQAERYCLQGRGVEATARAARRPRSVAAGPAESGVERLSGDARWWKADDGGAKTAKDRRIALTIEDTGVGISADKLDRIFDLYFTTKPQGSGIGLSIVYRIVQLHGGEIEVQSTEGHGTTFRLLLPEMDKRNQQKRDADRRASRRDSDWRGPRRRRVCFQSCGPAVRSRS